MYVMVRVTRTTATGEDDGKWGHLPWRMMARENTYHGDSVFR